jgi:galactofuranosylgalactofuranosylrhamnosyl-N-acetylglucosaminyl-diphospho-decaprenol beta-1,5/1,6-galactofuranosyltransferase
MRDPKKARELLAESVALHAQLFANWEKLRARYRKALPEITSMEAWKKTFDASVSGTAK